MTDETHRPATAQPHLTTERTYLEIQPADDPLRPDSVTRSITRLHRLNEGRGFFTSPSPPTYEFLFVATGTTGPTGTRSLDWYVGVADGELAALRRTLTACLPPSYDIVETECQYARALGLPFDVPTADPNETTAPLADWNVAGLRFHGVADRPDDWQLPLADLAAFDGADESHGDWPLTNLFHALAISDAPALAQILVQPTPDWTAVADDRIADLRHGDDTLGHWLRKFIATGLHHLLAPPTSDGRARGHDERAGTRPSRRTTMDTRADSQADTPAGPSPPTDPSIPASDARRIEALRDVNARQTFTVNARAVAFGTDSHAPETTLRRCRDAFQDVAGAHYRVQGRTHSYGSLAANTTLERILGREIQTDPTGVRQQLPLTRNTSPAIVTEPAAVGNFCLTGAPALSSAARRALETTPQERTGIELPARSILNRYLDADGLAIGQPRTANRDLLDAVVSLSPAVQPYHTLLSGTTGAGKSVTAHRMLFGNYRATAGADIYIDHKGDGGPEAYLQTHYATQGDLDDVYYFDCEEVLPALPLLSIEPQLAAGIDRQQAVENIADRHVETLAGYMGHEAFYSASTAVDVVEALIKALFDPVHGSDTISQHDLLITAARMHRTGEPPAVTDRQLHEQLVDVTANSANVFDNIMGAAVRRIRQATKDARLTPLFTHAADADSDAAFDFRDHLDEDCVIIFDTSGYRDDPRRLLTLTLISELWTALKRRKQQAATDAALPQVNLHLEEAADVATSAVLTDLLSQGRSFGVGVTVMLQFPGQVRESHPRVYRELLNDVGTHITGSVNVDRDLAEVFATRNMPADAVATRIRELTRGEWLVRPAAPFADEKPAPFICESLPYLPGHPEGDEPLEGTAETHYRAAATLLADRMHREHGLGIRDHTPTPAAAGDQAALPEGDADEPATAAVAATATIPHTTRLPAWVSYIDEPPYPLVCQDCERRYPATTAGMQSAVTCCHELADVDRDDVPICSVGLSLTAQERRESDWSDVQLRLLAAIYLAHQQQFDTALEYDIVWDSMVRLQEYVGAERADVDTLLDEGLLRKDCTQPHTLYTVTPAGRDELQISHREGVAHGDGQGDLSESSLHVAMAEAGRRFLAEQVVADPATAATRAKGYHEVEGGRIDAAALDDDGTVVAALEAELSNNDTRRAVPSDFDTMAACDPDRAVWIVKNRAGAHEVLQALNEPPEGTPRVEKTYSENMAPQDFTIDTDGLTDVVTFQYLRKNLLAAAGPGPEA